jgi:transcriptional regulator with XRE-family HTH domain
MKIPTQKKTTVEIRNEQAGEMIRELRERKGVSLLALSNAVGYSQQYVSDLERGRRNWSNDLFNKVEAAIRKLSVQQLPEAK